MRNREKVVFNLLNSFRKSRCLKLKKIFSKQHFDKLTTLYWDKLDVPTVWQILESEMSQDLLLLNITQVSSFLSFGKLGMFLGLYLTP